MAAKPMDSVSQHIDKLDGTNFHLWKFNPIVVGLFDSPILVGGGQKSPPYLTLDW